VVKDEGKTMRQHGVQQHHLESANKKQNNAASMGVNSTTLLECKHKETDRHA
jgi:hypothetical protein